jgi:CheY-like chemotaxis protein
MVPRGNEHILLVDDEPAVVEMLEIQLKRLGYKVTCSVKPEDALKLFRQDPHGFDVVITDLTMPKMTGLELAEKLSFIRPGLPIILCTAMNQAVSSTPDLKEAGISLVIQKPASRSEMAQAVRTVLEWKL